MFKSCLLFFANKLHHNYMFDRVLNTRLIPIKMNRLFIFDSNFVAFHVYIQSKRYVLKGCRRV